MTHLLEVVTTGKGPTALAHSSSLKTWFTFVWLKSECMVPCLVMTWPGMCSIGTSIDYMMDVCDKQHIHKQYIV